jgi:hypothetical protein
MSLEIKLNWISIKYFFLLVLQYLILIAISLLLDKLIECITMLPLFFIYTKKYSKQYHCATLLKCGVTTIAIFTLLFILMPSKNQFVFSGIIVMYVMTLISYYVRDYIDIKFPKKKKKNTNRQIIIDILGSNNLSEESIEEYCNKLGLINMSETIYLFLNNTLESTSEILDVNISTITRRINKFIRISRTY